MMRRYIWEDPSWPSFQWRLDDLAPSLRAAYTAQGTVLGAIRYVPPERTELLEVDTRTDDAVDTSRIEGERLDPESVRSSIARRLKIKLRHQTASSADADAIAEVTVDATKSAMAPLTVRRLLRWHEILFHGSTQVVGGTFRSSLPPMQVISGPIHQPRVHFEAPPSQRVVAEVDQFLIWAARQNLQFGAGNDGLLRAAVAQLWFVTIHPFEDGNGRISRAIADLFLARAFPDVSRYVSMTHQIAAQRKNYYKVLEDTQRGSLDITAWLKWFLTCYAAGCAATVAVLDAAHAATRVWDQANAVGLSDRQRRVISRLLDGFEGNLNSRKYAVFAGNVSDDTAQRDLSDLVVKGIMERTGAGKRTAYRLHNAGPNFSRTLTE